MEAAPVTIEPFLSSSQSPLAFIPILHLTARYCEQAFPPVPSPRFLPEGVLLLGSFSFMRLAPAAVGIATPYTVQC